MVIERLIDCVRSCNLSIEDREIIIHELDYLAELEALGMQGTNPGFWGRACARLENRNKKLRVVISAISQDEPWFKVTHKLQFPNTVKALEALEEK